MGICFENGAPRAQEFEILKNFEDTIWLIHCSRAGREKRAELIYARKKHLTEKESESRSHTWLVICGYYYSIS